MQMFKLIVAAALLVTGSATVAQQAAELAPSLLPAVAPKAVESTQTSLPASRNQRTLDKADVDAWLDGFMPYALDTGDIAGAVVVVVKDGEVVTQRGFGYADVAKRTPVDPARTLFRPGSVSKLFTWAAVMQQVEAGRIDLDADVNAYLDFKIPAKDGKPVTMRQLMTHTAGFEELSKDIIFYDMKNHTSLAEYMKRLPPKRIYAAGSTPAYSNYGTALAGYIVERVTKMTFDDYVDQHIFKRLGMAHSTFRQPLPKALAPLMATGYDRASGEPSKFEIIGPAPAGSLSSTGSDMAKFMIANLNKGAGLMAPETARMMHDTPLTMLPPLNRMELGFFETNINGRQVIGHLGDTVAFHTSLHLFMNENVGFYVSFSSEGKEGAAGTLRAALFERFADRYFPDAAAAVGKVDTKTAAKHAEMMTGQWLNSRRFENSYLAITNLAGQVTISVDDKGGLVVPAVLDKSGTPVKWVEIAPFVWRERDGHMRLAAKVEDGKVVRWSFDMVSPFMMFEPVPAAKSSAWLLPLLIASIGVLLLTFLHWPVSALIRRRYKAPLALDKRGLQAYRSIRIGAGMVVGVLICCAAFLAMVMADISKFSASSDGILWLLQVLGLIVFVAGVLLAGWNLRQAWKTGRGWFGKLWAVLILVAMLTVLYVSWAFGLLSMTVNY